MRSTPSPSTLTDLARLLRIQESFRAFVNELQATHVTIGPALRRRLLEIDTELIGQLRDIFTMPKSIGVSHPPSRAAGEPRPAQPDSTPAFMRSASDWHYP